MISLTEAKGHRPKKGDGPYPTMNEKRHKLDPLSNPLTWTLTYTICIVGTHVRIRDKDGTYILKAEFQSLS